MQNSLAGRWPRREGADVWLGHFILLCTWPYPLSVLSTKNPSNFQFLEPTPCRNDCVLQPLPVDLLRIALLLRPLPCPSLLLFSSLSEPVSLCFGIQACAEALVQGGWWRHSGHRGFLEPGLLISFGSLSGVSPRTDRRGTGQSESQQQLIIQHLICALYCSKYFIGMQLFNLCHSPMRCVSQAEARDRRRMCRILKSIERRNYLQVWRGFKGTHQEY